MVRLKPGSALNFLFSMGALSNQNRAEQRNNFWQQWSAEFQLREMTAAPDSLRCISDNAPSWSSALHPGIEQHIFDNGP
jgi:hypothetical protein